MKNLFYVGFFTTIGCVAGLFFSLCLYKLIERVAVWIL